MMVSNFVTKAEVAGVTKSWYDVFMLIHTWVDSCTPDGRLVIGEGLTDVVDAFGGSYHTAHMDALGDAAREKGFVTQFHTATGGQHRVGDDEVFLLDARRC